MLVELEVTLGCRAASTLAGFSFLDEAEVGAENRLLNRGRQQVFPPPPSPPVSVPSGQVCRDWLCM